MQRAGSATSQSLTDNDEATLELFSPEFLLAAQECLSDFWAAQGMERDKAKRAAQKGIRQIHINARRGKWCLLPDVSDD